MGKALKIKTLEKQKDFNKKIQEENRQPREKFQ
jgi:hypothetical protein